MILGLIISVFCSISMAIEIDISRTLESQSFNKHLSTEVTRETAARFHAWARLIAESRKHSDDEKIKATNAFFNDELFFSNDSYQWRKEDYWATPLEFLFAGAGDCEDFAIAKYFTLLEMGVSQDKLRIIYGHIQSLNEKHVILGYYNSRPDETFPLVLDSLGNSHRPANKLYSLKEQKDFIPVYSFNNQSLWIINGSKSLIRGSSLERLTEWRRMLGKFKQELIFFGESTP